jgi:cell fate (sporulation/competence/biofilm development) regulator YlbF (YheA/YmcA/DUF963 family)
VYITSELIKIQEMSEELARDILKSDLGLVYIKNKMAMESDHDAQEKISNFLHNKKKFEEISKYGKYHPEYKELSKKVRVLKREMDMHPSIAAFKMAETKFEALLEDVSRILGHSVSKNIMIPSSNPLYSKGHKKGCGHGGGCGCSG